MQVKQDSSIILFIQNIWLSYVKYIYFYLGSREIINETNCIFIKHYSKNENKLKKTFKK